MPVPLFALGHVVATPGALRILEASGLTILILLGRHVQGDWGDLSPEDVRENELSLRCGFRIFSNYTVDEHRVWIITEADRSSTCILLPDEY